MFARTERLLLRPSWPEDAQELRRAIADEAIVRNLVRAPWPCTEAEAKRFVALEHSESYPTFLLMQRTDGAPRLVGACGLGEKDGEAELAYWIARPLWGLGYATEAARAVIEIAKTLGHSRLIAGHFIDNPASGRVLRKVGFRATGRSEQRLSKGRGAGDACTLYEKPLVHGQDKIGPRAFMPTPTMREHFATLRAA